MSTDVDPAVMYCHLHPTRETMRSCTRCERPTCSSCLRDAPVGQHCLACMKGAAPSAKTQVARNVRSTKGHLKALAAPVTTALVAINAVVFVLGYAQTQSNLTAGRGNDIVRRLILWAPDVAHGQWYRLITAGFLHQAIWHIGMNMLALWRIGSIWEQRLGPWRYLGVYMAALLGGSLSVMMLAPQNPVLGASGAIYGFLGMEFIAYRQRKIPISKSPLAQVLAINFVLSLVLRVSIMGHLGGFILGAIVGGIFVNPKRRNTNASKDVLLITGICVVLFLAGVYFAKNPINANGVFSR